MPCIRASSNGTRWCCAWRRKPLCNPVLAKQQPYLLDRAIHHESGALVKNALAWRNQPVRRLWHSHGSGLGANLWAQTPSGIDRVSGISGQRNSTAHHPDSCSTRQSQDAQGQEGTSLVSSASPICLPLPTRPRSWMNQVEQWCEHFPMQAVKHRQFQRLSIVF